MEIESEVREGAPVYLTKNGYGTMVEMSLETYSRLMDRTEDALDEADRFAKASSSRMTHQEVFTTIGKQLHDE